MNTRPIPHRFCSLPRAAGLLALLGGLTCVEVTFADPGKGKGQDKGKEKGHGVAHSADFIPPGHRRAPVEVIVLQAPPALRVEVISARPSVAHVWVTGYWVWESSAYLWVPSGWMRPPEPTAVWIAPRYEERSGVHVSISGFWKI